MNTLRAGPVISVNGASIIPVLRLTRGYMSTALWAMLVPVAVVLVRNRQVRAWTIDGTPSPVDQWLNALPELAAMIEDAEASRV